MAQVSIRMDETLKNEAEILFGELGLNMTTAVNMFVKAAIRKNGIPFEIKMDPFYSTKNQTRIIEAFNDLDEGKGMIFKTMEELEAMENE